MRAHTVEIGVPLSGEHARQLVKASWDKGLCTHLVPLHASACSRAGGGSQSSSMTLLC